MKRSTPAEKDAQAVKIPYLKIVLCLFLICSVCAALLGLTYTLTEAPIAENERQAIQRSLTSVFGEGMVFESTAVPQGQNAEAVYLAKNGEGLTVGYGIRVLSRGFSDDIDIIVGFDTAGQIVRVQILALSETAGVGSLINEPDYLSQYEGKSGQLTLKQDIDAISGATKSSRALIDGVNLAQACFTALAA